MFISAHESMAVERFEDCAAVPFVAGLLDYLQHHRPIVLAPPSDQRRLGLETLVDDDVPLSRVFIEALERFCVDQGSESR